MESLNENKDMDKEDGELSSDDGDDTQNESPIKFPQSNVENRALQSQENESQINPHSAKFSMNNWATNKGKGVITGNYSTQKGGGNRNGAESSCSLRSVRHHDFKTQGRRYNHWKNSLSRRSKSPMVFSSRRFWSPSIRPSLIPAHPMLFGGKKPYSTSEQRPHRRRTMADGKTELKELKKARWQIRKQLRDLENEVPQLFDSILDAVEDLDNPNKTELPKVWDLDPEYDSQSGAQTSTALNYTSESTGFHVASDQRQDKLLPVSNALSVHAQNTSVPPVFSPFSNKYQSLRAPDDSTPFPQYLRTLPRPTECDQVSPYNKEQSNTARKEHKGPNMLMPVKRRESSEIEPRYYHRDTPFNDPKLLYTKNAAVSAISNILPEPVGCSFPGANSRDAKDGDKSIDSSDNILRQLHNIRYNNEKPNKPALWKITDSPSIKDPRDLLNYSDFDGDLTLSEDCYNQHKGLQSISRPSLERKSLTERKPILVNDHSNVGSKLIIKVSTSAHKSAHSRRVELTVPSKNRRNSYTSQDHHSPKVSEGFTVSQKHNPKLRVRPPNEASSHTPPIKKMKSGQALPNLIISINPNNTPNCASQPNYDQTNSDSEDESMQRLKLLQDMQLKREANNKTQNRATSSVVSPSLGNATSESPEAAALMETEEMFVDNEKMGTTPSDILSPFQKQHVTGVQSSSDLSLSNPNEPQFLSELCKIKLSLVKNTHKSDPQGNCQTPLQEAVKSDQCFNEENTNCSDPHTDVSVLKMQRAVPEERSQLAAVEDKITMKENCSTITMKENCSTITMKENCSTASESIDLHKVNCVKVETFVTTPARQETEGIPELEDQFTFEEKDSIAVGSTYLSQMQKDSSINVVMKAEKHIQEEISGIAAANDSHFIVAMNTQLSDLEDRADINQKETISCTAGNWSFVPELDPKIAELDPKIADLDPKIAELDPKIAELDPKIADLDPKIAAGATDLDSAVSEVAELDPGAAKLSPDVAYLNYGISGVAVITDSENDSEETSKLPVVEDIKMEEDQFFREENTDLISSSSNVVRANTTNDSKEGSQFPIVEDIKMEVNHFNVEDIKMEVNHFNVEDIKMEVNHFHVEENTDPYKSDISVVMITSSTQVSREMPYFPVIEGINTDNDIMEKKNCSSTDMTPEKTGDFTKVAQKQDLEEMSRLPEGEHRNTTDEINHNKTEGTDLQKLDISKINDFVTETQTEHSHPIEVVFTDRNRKEEKNGARTAQKHQNSLHLINLEKSTPTAANSKHVYVKRSPAAMENFLTAVCGGYGINNDSNRGESNSHAKSPLAMINTFDARTNDNRNAKSADVTLNSTPSKQKSVSFSEGPSFNKTTALESKSSKGIFQRLGPPIETDSPKAVSAPHNPRRYSWTSSTLSNKTQAVQHEPGGQRRLSSTQIPGAKTSTAGVSAKAYSWSRANSAGSPDLAIESCSSKTAAAPSQSPESQYLPRHLRPQQSLINVRARLGKKRQLPVHAPVVVLIRSPPSSEDGFEGEREVQKFDDEVLVRQKGGKHQREAERGVLGRQKGGKRQREAERGVLDEREQDKKINHSEHDIQEPENLDSLKKEMERYQNLRSNEENNLSKLRCKIKVKEKLIKKYKDLEDQAQEKIKSLIEEQNSSNQRELVNVELAPTPQEQSTGGITSIYTDPPQESTTNKAQSLTRAQLMTLKKQKLLQQETEINEKIRKLKAYIAKKQNEPVSAASTNSDAASSSETEVISQDEVRIGMDPTEMEKQNSVLEMEATLQTDGANVATNIKIEQMDLSESSILLRKERETVDENMNCGLSPVLELPEKSQVSSFLLVQVGELCSDEYHSTEGGDDADG